MSRYKPPLDDAEFEKEFPFIAASRRRKQAEQAHEQPITSPLPAEQPKRERKSQLVRLHGPVRALAVARMFIRWHCEKTAHLQRLQTADRLAEACRNWALTNSLPAFVTTYVMRAALECEGIREFNDGFRSPWYALRINRREIDLPSARKQGQE